MPSGSVLMDEAFGHQMLEGTAEWREVPEVVRSSFYVLHKVLRRMDQRLARCEQVVPAIAPTAEWQAELACKVDRSVFLSTLHASSASLQDECLRAVHDKVDAVVTRIDTLVMTLKKGLARRLQRAKVLFTILCCGVR
ncbi:hypothetical protein ACHHYP_13674 [Achlya hypogyna]|uniref:Uncharacterized protein n=1 Tax=Achlya hypogyna TaxID=1202772 RepID=A0A1V9YEZ3_ACHHY|nr:hypothetical protein ACHHYP_13674 [Achlya hypogyna]